MKKLIATMAIAGLGATLAAGAQAQTVGSNPAGSYLVNVSESTSALTTTTDILSNTVTGYFYTYTETLQSIKPGLAVNSFTFGFAAPGDFNPLVTPTNPGGVSFANISTPNDETIVYSSATGLTTVGQSTQLQFFSPLPPTGTINITPSASGSASGAGAGAGAPFPGPGAAVPEAGSFALLGIGLLPLALLARRRMVRSN